MKSPPLLFISKSYALNYKIRDEQNRRNEQPTNRQMGIERD